VTKTYQDKDITGDVDYETKEILGYSFTLTNGDDWTQSFGELGMLDGGDCVDYVRTEATDRLSVPTNYPLNPGVSWIHRRGVWEKFLIPDKNQFHYSYPERIHGSNQMHTLRYFHEKDPSSRQLIVQIYNQDKDSGLRVGGGRVPCTMHYQFLHRGDQFYTIVNMRSCDLYTHFAIDMSIAWHMGAILAEEWGATCSKLIMQFGSLHAFAKDLKPRGIF
jgi:hypothetical protein